MSSILTSAIYPKIAVVPSMSMYRPLEPYLWVYSRVDFPRHMWEGVLKCICGLPSPFHQFGFLVTLASACSLTDISSHTAGPTLTPFPAISHCYHTPEGWGHLCTCPVCQVGCTESERHLWRLWPTRRSPCLALLRLPGHFLENLCMLFCSYYLKTKNTNTIWLGGYIDD